MKQPRIDRTCSHCDKKLSAKNKTGRCLSHLALDPDFAARRGRAVSAARAYRSKVDPDFAEMQREKGRWLAATGLGHAAMSGDPEARKRAARGNVEAKIGWCPPEYRDEYRLIRRNLSCARVAKQRILQRIEADAQSAIMARAMPRLDDAIFYLRRLAPVYRVPDGFAYGTVVLTAEQLVARALLKGWQP